MRRNALQCSSECERRIVAVLFVVFVLVTQVGTVVAGAGTSNPGP